MMLFRARSRTSHSRSAVAHVPQCPWCIYGHTRAAKRLGATDEEIAEAVFVAMEMRAGAAFTHGAIAMAAVADHEQPL